MIDLSGIDLGDYNWIINALEANKWLKALFILVVFFFLAELVTLIMEKFVLRLTKKTKTKLDDKLVKRVKNPISLLMFFIGLRLAVGSLQLAAGYHRVSLGIANSLIVIFVIYLVIAVLKSLFAYWKESKSKALNIPVNDSLLLLTNKTLSILFFIISFVAILKVWGVEIGPLLAGLGVGGIAIAFAMQKTLGNVFGGIALILDESINVNDVVQLENGTLGKITDIGLRSTKVKTMDNEVIIIPNGKLEEMNIQNVVKPEPSIRIVIPFSVAYGTKIEKVKKIVMAEIRKIKGVIKGDEEKPMVVRFLKMDDSSLNFKAFFWIPSYENRFEAIDAGTTRIYDILNKNKISIPFPQIDVHMKKS